jgi:hypothetical protein
MANLTGVSGSTIRTEINNEVMAYDESFNMNLQYYYTRNSKIIATFESTEGWTNNSWSATVGTVANDSTNYKVGSQGISITSPNNLGGGKLSKVMDLTAFHNGGTSSTSDYIQFCMYITTAEIAKLHADGILLAFLCDTAPTITNYFSYAITAASLVNGWNFISIPKSSFSTVGSANWANVKGLHFVNNGAPTSGSPLYTIDAMRMVRKDPSTSAANPFQRLVDATWTRDFAINSGHWFIGLENNKIICRDLNPLSSVNSLSHTKTLKNFNYSSIFTCQQNTQTCGIAWYVDSSNYIGAWVSSDNLLLKLKQAAVDTDYTVALPVVAGDKIAIELVKNGASVQVLAYKNGNVDNPYSLSAPTTISNASAGSLNIFFRLNIKSDLLSAGFSLVPYAIRSGESEQAKNVISQIGGKDISSIFESDGITAKTATSAGTAITMDGVRIRAYRSTEQNINPAGIIEFDSETLDPKNKFASYVATPGIGTYFVHTKLTNNNPTEIYIRKNNTNIVGVRGYLDPVEAKYLVNLSTIIQITNSEDTIKVFSNGASTILGGEAISWIDIIQIA